jgi:hypothetical protein
MRLRRGIRMCLRLRADAVIGALVVTVLIARRG